MAPRMPRDYHSAAEPNSYSLRTTTKRSEDHVLRAHNFDVSKITGKEDFLRSMGLQLKRHQYEYRMLNGSHRTKKINIPDGVKLRDCSVVILGSTCKICGRHFKCAMDLIVHKSWKHRRCQETDNAVRNESTSTYDINDKTCEIVSETSEDAEISVGGSPVIKLQRRLRLTLKIGEEVVARMTMKRKHLRMNHKTDMATQTEATDNADELIIGKGEGAVPRIDLPVFDNSPCQCCNSGLHVVNSTNRYLAGNIVANKDTKWEENAKNSPILKRVTMSCATQASGKVDSALDVLSRRMSCNLRATGQNDAEDCNSSVILSPNATERPASCGKDINANVNTPSEKKSQNSGTVNTVIAPLILPIVVSHNTPTSAAEARVTVSRQESPKSSDSVEKNDDEVQEVLRIVRGRSNSEEINHESPNRSEQEMLVRDAIKDMIRMEEQGWHLLEKEPSKKKTRVVERSDVRSCIRNAHSAKRKMRATITLDAAVNVSKNTKEHCVSNVKEPSAKVQHFNQVDVCMSDNVKENLITWNGNISVSSEMLRRYGINYYNETFEINNNTQTVQEPVSYFLAPCSGGMENRSNKPTIIDLVNDIDE